MSNYKGIDFDESLGALIRHMDSVEEYRETLQTLQATWDNLTLLGQLSGNGTDMSATRQAFAALTADLLNHLGIETRNKVVQALKSKAQVAVDIMVRNLFERTADIGFLALDDDIRDFARCMCGLIERGEDVETCRDHRQRIEQRFQEYVRKYSVYNNIVLLDPQGRVLAQLDHSNGVSHSNDPLVSDALHTDDAYVEVFRPSDLLAHSRAGLIYAYRVTEADGRPLAVLCLCFRFENEVQRIFANLEHPEDWTVLALLDRDGQVIASSDPFHLPVGAPMERVLGADWGVVRFGGREYLATTRETQGYQGYMGPGWMGHAMVPIEHAFDRGGADRLDDMPGGVVAAVMKSPTLFSDELRSIPRQAEQIQRALNRSVWNGNVRQSSSETSINSSFSKVLLWEISNTGLKTTDVFERSIGNLNETVISSILDDSRFFATLAIDIMDRNLYERANDCRWWALTTLFREELTQRSENSRDNITRVLEAINALYTVYDNLVVFDAGGTVIAVSNPYYDDCVGRPVGEEWVRRCVGLPDTQSYVVSGFDKTPLYRNRNTYIYAAAIGIEGKGNARGGIGIVFDAEPQFLAMLQDSLPRSANGEVMKGSFAVFADRSKRVIASTDERFRIGAELDLPASLFALSKGRDAAEIHALDGQYYAVGARMSAGYREYKSASDAYVNDLAALVFVPLGEVQCLEARAPSAQEPVRVPRQHHRSEAGGSTEVATFYIGEEWLGLVSSRVLEAVDAVGITSLPGMPDHVHGVFMYGERPVLVLDLKAHLRFRKPVDASGYQQIVIVRGRGEEPFGILVHRLGEIPEVANDRIDAVNELFQSDSALAESVVRPIPDAGDKSILVVLSADRIVARLLGGRARISEAAALPLRALEPTNLSAHGT